MEQTLYTASEIKPEKKATSLSPFFQQYLQDYAQEEAHLQKSREKSINIDDLALTVGQAYEKVRKVIDWKEENALRRGAIYRSLKRSLVGQIYGLDRREIAVEAIGEKILLELMRSGYFNNDLIGTAEEKRFANVFAKYVEIIVANQKEAQLAKNNLHRKAKKDFKRKMKFQTWVLELAACEIEECLSPDYKMEAIAQLMIRIMTERIVIFLPKKNQLPLTEIDKKIQINLAVNRSLLSLDGAALSYQVIKIRYPFWMEAGVDNHQEILARIEEIYDQVESDLENKSGKSFKLLTDHYDAAYRLIGHINDEINHYAEDQQSKPKSKFVIEEKNLTKRLSMTEQLAFWQNEAEVSKQLELIYNQRRKTLKSRLLRSAVWSTLSVILSDIVTIILIEGPLASLIGQDFTIVSLLADLLVPSALMFVLIMLIRLPPEDNYAVVENEIKKIVYENANSDRYQVKLRSKQANRISNFVFNSFYTLAAASGLFFIIWVMYICNLPLTSVFINTITTTMIFGVGLSVKVKAKEITIKEKGHFGEFILEIFSVPLAKIGSWFSNKWREYNVVAILFSVLVDTPFSALIGLISDWRDFLTERAAEIKGD